MKSMKFLRKLAENKKFKFCTLLSSLWFSLSIILLNNHKCAEVSKSNIYKNLQLDKTYLSFEEIGMGGGIFKYSSKNEMPSMAQQGFTFAASGTGPNGMIKLVKLQII